MDSKAATGRLKWNERMVTSTSVSLLVFFYLFIYFLDIIHFSLLLPPLFYHRKAIFYTILGKWFIPAFPNLDNWAALMEH